MTRSLCALVLLLATLPVVRAADRLVIVPSSDRQPGLLLPSDWLAQHRPVSQEAPGYDSPALPAIIAGIALTLGLALTGLLLARRCSARFVAGATACLLAALMLINSSCSSKDHRDDDIHHRRHTEVYRGISGPSLQTDGTLQGEVLVEEGAAGDAVLLVVNPQALQVLKMQLQAEANP